MDPTSEYDFFISLARNGALSATARELNLTPSAVTKRLTNLESRLGVRLVNRTTRKVSLTNEGEVYLEYIKNIKEQIEEMEAVITKRRSTPRGLLRVNAPLGFGRTYIAPILSEFLSENPAVEIQLMLTDRPMTLPDDSIDVCIRFGQAPDSRVIARKIAPNRRLVCAAPSYLKRYPKPNSPADLAEHNCIIIKQNQQVASAWRFYKNGKEEVIKVKANMVTNDGEIALRWAIDGHGLVMRAEWDLAKYIRQGKLEIVLEDYETPEADIYAVYMERQNQSAKLTRFLDYLQDSFLNSENKERSFW
ncbi:LysR family transcriptional regulator [Marinomonas mediterranea]|uniref:Transcriptional regulator, LysR family n=1 Tax=Marinomonas mediterranea (strain ATCC 700492 / JCM 21426 / NBRC 103028 / MMB-1) TaxID=717774 RepID=F2JY05_MARM1|nr:LysR family transcriptional regulator [Marinomonas mediterranea]ADZ89654.1 transcriptional regulator, LysR family [Marinomonas mediterranea MMB-1]WCN15891.1 LysR family transcriptional regulator [Marinomonas mediterranea MMB-1]